MREDKEFIVRITETLVRDVKVNAYTKKVAEDRVRRKYDEGYIKLSENDFSNLEIACLSKEQAEKEEREREWQG